MAPSPANSNNNNKNDNDSTVVDLSSSFDNDKQDHPDDVPADPYNPYDSRHFMHGGMHSHLLKRKNSASSEASATPSSKRPTTMPGSEAVQSTMPKRETTGCPPTAPAKTAFRNTPRDPMRTGLLGATIVNSPPVSSNLRNPPLLSNAPTLPPQPFPSHVLHPPPPAAPQRSPTRQSLTDLYISSPSYRSLLFEMKSEKSLHALKLAHMHEIHAVEERLGQERHSTDMRRLQERIIEEKGHWREKKRLEEEGERERHEQKMALLSRQVAAEQRVVRERVALARQGLDTYDGAVGGQ